MAAANGARSVADGGGSVANGAGSVADGGFRRLLKQHVANIKHIVGNDQATLMVDRNSAICCLR